MVNKPHRGRPVRTLLVLLGGLIAVGAAVGFYTVYVRPVAAAVNTATGQVVPRLPVPSAAEVGDGASPTGAAAQAAAPTVVPAPTPPPLTGNEPINILLLGSDTDAKFSGGYNAQTIIVVTIVPATKKVTMLSIPRDMWVNVPGVGAEKISLAYGAGGIALARQTVETDLGIPIHYYAWVGLEGFVKVVDTFGGVDVDVSHPIVDDAYPDDVGTQDAYAYRRLYIPAGLQHLDGMRALQYVRSRHGDQIGDFGRSQRQQQVLDAVRSKTGGKDMVTHLPELATELKDSVRTDMTLQDIARFAVFADQLRGEAVQQVTLLPPNYSDYGTTGDGQDVVIPNWRNIRPLVDQLFHLSTTTKLPMTVPGLGQAPPTRTPTPGGITPAASGVASASSSAASSTVPRSSEAGAAVASRSGAPAATAGNAVAPTHTATVRAVIAVATPTRAPAR